MKASEFQYMRIETESGRFLGHVFDLRSRGEPEYGVAHDARILTEIVYGRIGLFERLGLVQADPTTIPWKAVKRIRDNTIVVDDSAAPRTGK
jgi:sporulation protein YlmC with PRC-barrel domain